MKSLAALPERSLEVPRLLVAAAQPYQTLAGPALTINFSFLPNLLPFQSLPFSNSMVAPLYYHTLLHSLTEFAETPRPSRHSHVRQLSAPKADVWHSVGTLNTFYHTMYPPCPSIQTREETVGLASRLHPAMGAVELVRAAHRKEHDVRLTLYNEAHEAVSALLITGPSEHIRTESNATREDELARIPLPQMPLPPLASSSPTGAAATDGYWSPTERRQLPENSPLRYPYAFISGPLAAVGGLYGDVVPLAGNTSWGHRACFQLGTTAAAADAGAVVPPWALYQLVVDFTARLFEATSDGSLFGTGFEALVSSLPGAGEVPLEWCLCAQQVVLADDVVFGEALDVVCAAPRVALDYRLPPWRRVIGQPALRGGSPCVTMRAEVRQRGHVCLSGTFFIVPIVGTHTQTHTRTHR